MREVVVHRNFGQAQEMSSRFFDSVRTELAASSSGPFRDDLTDVLSRRDVVTASLAKGDEELLAMLRAIEVRMRRTLSYPVLDQRAAEQSDG
jgi:hypothetical protein